MLNHPNILAIYDIGDEDGVRYIVSELLEGESLRARIRQSPVPPRKALDYAAQIGKAIAVDDITLCQSSTSPTVRARARRLSDSFTIAVAPMATTRARMCTYRTM